MRPHRSTIARSGATMVVATTTSPTSRLRRSRSTRRCSVGAPASGSMTLPGSRVAAMRASIVATTRGPLTPVAPDRELPQRGRACDGLETLASCFHGKDMARVRETSAVYRALNSRKCLAQPPCLFAGHFGRVALCKLDHQRTIEIVGILAENPLCDRLVSRPIEGIPERSVREELQVQHTIEAAGVVHRTCALDQRRQAKCRHREGEDRAGRFLAQRHDELRQVEAMFEHE